MRPEYLVHAVGRADQFWVFEKALLPKYESLLHEFNGKREREINERSKAKRKNEYEAFRSEELKNVKHPNASQEKITPITESKSPAFGELPPFPSGSIPAFKWGPRDGADFINDVNVAYEITTKWRKNVFKLPSGQSGKSFTLALSRLYDAYASRSPLECIALKAAAILVPLLLQQPAGKPQYRDNVVTLAGSNYGKKEISTIFLMREQLSKISCPGRKN